MVDDMIDDMGSFEGNDGVYIPMRLVEDCTGLEKVILPVSDGSLIQDV
jgi:hypothetical protein